MLDIGSNKFSGNISVIEGMSLATEFRFDDNILTGSMPKISPNVQVQPLTQLCLCRRRIAVSLGAAAYLQLQRALNIHQHRVQSWSACWSVHATPLTRDNGFCPAVHFAWAGWSQGSSLRRCWTCRPTICQARCRQSCICPA